MADFILADNGILINVDHIFDLRPQRGGKGYVAHYAGVDGDGDVPATAVVSASAVHRYMERTTASTRTEERK